jgi:hypothetical protein
MQVKEEFRLSCDVTVWKVEYGTHPLEGLRTPYKGKGTKDDWKERSKELRQEALLVPHRHRLASYLARPWRNPSK